MEVKKKIKSEEGRPEMEHVTALFKKRKVDLGNYCAVSLSLWEYYGTNNPGNHFHMQQ